MTSDLWLLFGYLAAVLALESARSLLYRRAPAADRTSASVPTGRKVAMAACGAGTAILILALLVVWFIVNGTFKGVWPLGIRAAGVIAAASWFLISLVEWGFGFRVVSVGLRSHVATALRRTWRSAAELGLATAFVAVTTVVLVVYLRG
ncbi:MAG: hypothetical protein ABFD77_09690 [Thermotogota bacterium]